MRSVHLKPMRWSKLFIPTLREAPAGIPTEGGRLLARAGYARGAALLFLGRRSMRRIASIIRQAMDPLGAQELWVPAGESMTALARELRSYKQLPQIWYQFRDGFEACSFGVGPEHADFRDAFCAVLRRCGVEYLTAGSTFAIPCDAGEDFIARAGEYLADLPAAVSDLKPPSAPDSEGEPSPESFHTPNRKTIAELADFTGLPESSHIKSLVMVADGTLVMALLRGDHQLSEAKLARALEAAEVRPASAEEIRRHFGAGAGSLGPVGVEGVRVLSDEALRGRRNMIAGANRDDYHLRHVTPGKDFITGFFDLRLAAEGDTYNGEPLRIEKATVLGSLSEARSRAELHVTGAAGQEVPVWVASCTISLDRILWAVAEQHHDRDGLTLPPEIAPFDLIVTPVDFSGEAQRNAGERIAEEAGAVGMDVLLDDRDERPGVKFKDADLTGVPWRVTIGKKLEQGIVEVVDRRRRQKTDVAVDEAAAFINTRR